MITNNTITARFAADRHATIAWKQQLSADLDAIVAAYGAADKPADTIATAAAEIGIDRVRAIVATLAAYRVAMHDRRIGDDTAAWAQTIADALDADAAERVGLITDAIHPAHLDQLARAAAEYVEPETAETTETTETTPAAEPETETETAETETTERAESPEIIARMTEIITTAPAHSAWARGVKAYAVELCSSLRGAVAYAAETGTPSPRTDRETVRAALLNGARDWSEYSWGGCALIYDGDIAARVCTPSELRRTHGGRRDPNPRETWLDVQARALCQAGAAVLTAYSQAAREGARA